MLFGCHQYVLRSRSLAPVFLGLVFHSNIHSVVDALLVAGFDWNWLRRIIISQFSKQLRNRLATLFGRVGEVHFRPSSHVRRQQGIQEWIQLRIG
jgi:hypothetical protein